jgi:hypothetical protein
MNRNEVSKGQTVRVLNRTNADGNVWVAKVESNIRIDAATGKPFVFVGSKGGYRSLAYVENLELAAR